MIILKSLIKGKLISKGNIRLSQRQHDKNAGIYAEIPYYLSEDLDSFRSLMREITKTHRPYDTGFLLEIIDNSKYLMEMKKQFGEEMNAIIHEELSKRESPYSDPFFTKIIEPELVEELFCNLERLVCQKSLT
jgi:hypothetical protein